MFERDKDELRRLGIEIEVGQVDPLFEDELGYLIRSSSIQIQPGEFSEHELLLMTMSGNLWKESAVSGISENALMKMASLDSEIGSNKIALPLVQDRSFNIEIFNSIIEAMQQSRYIEFTYKGKKRLVAPLGIKNTKGFWYLVAQENKGDIKVFKLIRIQSEIEIASEKDQFSKPMDFDINSYLESALTETRREAIVMIRENKANDIRNKGEVLKSEGEWDQLRINFDDMTEFVSELLWYGDDLYVISPEDLRRQMISNLKYAANG